MSAVDRLLARPAVGPALVAGLGFAVWSAVLGFDLVWDDKTLLANNPYLRRFDTLWLAFATDFWALADTPGWQQMYRPLVVVSYWLDVRLWGGSLAEGAHLVNLALHALVSALVVLLGRRLGLPPVGALFAGALFCVHPIQVEAVANVASRTDLMATAFLLGGLLIWSGEGRARLWALPLLLAALLSKESAVAGPLLAMGAAWFVRRERLDARALAPLLVWVVYAAMRFAALSDAPAGVGRVDVSNDGGAALWEGGYRIVRYLGDVVFPVHRAPVTPMPHPGWAAVAVCTLAVGLAAVLLLHPRVGARARLLAAWFALAILPVSELIPIGVRYSQLLLYLPAVALALAAGSLPLEYRFARVTAAGLVALCAVVSMTRVGVWADDRALWTHGTRVHPENPLMNLNLANALRAEGEEREGCALLAQNFALLAVRPSQDVEVRTHYNLGNCARLAGDPTQAVLHYRRALERSFGHLHQARHNLAIVLMELGRNGEAYGAALEAVELQPELAPSWQLFGVAAARAGRPEEAARAFERALELDPGDARSRELLERLRARSDSD